ncbi:MAG: ketopantoate reductase family protein [Sulfurifustaceae bacterium]
MGPKETIYILGSGAVGFPLAAYLTNAGRKVVAVRTSKKNVPRSIITVTVRQGTNHVSAPIETISLSNLTRLDGTIVIATKSYANQAIAQELKDRGATGPVVVMQNGVGVERPFVDAQLSPIYRCILYITSQTVSENDYTFSMITPSPIGVAHGDESSLEQCAALLTTPEFPFRLEANIQREAWKKTIINAVFNSICPLLEVDNGIFARDEETANLAREVVRECVTLTDRLNMRLSESELMEQLMRISKGSKQLISTLQDIRTGRQTEIDALNLEIARVAALTQPRVHLPRVELLGKMILIKSLQHRKTAPAST